MRKTHNKDFKFKVALEAIRGDFGGNGIRLSPYRYNFRGITTFPLGIRFS